MLRYIPIALGVIALVGATWWQAQIVDRWGASSISVEELNARFERVPMEIGGWKGVDQEVTDEITNAAGAVAHVNRIYTNPEDPTEQVALWLIVGHAKDIIRHTPNVCYPSQGFVQPSDEVKYQSETADGSEAKFWTTVFRPGSGDPRGRTRVFWAWAVPPEEGQPPKWQAPGDDSGDARFEFGNTTALFKLYFTSLEGLTQRTASETPSAEFAKICIPAINNAIFGSPAQTSQTSSDAEQSPLGAESATPAKAQQPAS